jgi:antitoxin component YwqK of YwqJK toxin-antitoxin module
MSHNDKGQSHGLWERYYPNGQLWYKCTYHNDKLVGYDEVFLYNSKSDRKVYHL